MGKKSRQKWINREEKAHLGERKSKRMKKAIKITALVIIILAIIVGGYFIIKKYMPNKTTGPNSTQTDTNAKVEDNEIATLETSQGTIKVQLYRSQAPKAVDNFIKLANEGFYDGTKFHRVIKDFMIQGGDPLSKDDAKKSEWGTGGPGYKFNDEAVKLEYKRGIVAMANSGANTNGSQFFIMHQDNLTLPKNYTIFGNVIEGMDVVDKIAITKTDSTDKPLENMVIKKITITKQENTAKVPEPAKTSDEPIKVQATTTDGVPIDITAEPVKN